MNSKYEGIPELEIGGALVAYVEDYKIGNLGITCVIDLRVVGCKEAEPRDLKNHFKCDILLLKDSPDGEWSCVRGEREKVSIMIDSLGEEPDFEAAYSALLQSNECLWE